MAPLNVVFSAHYSLFTFHYSLSTIHYSLIAAHFLPGANIAAGKALYKKADEAGNYFRDKLG